MEENRMQGYGVFLENGPQDWQIFQQENGKCGVPLSGAWRIRPEERTASSGEPCVMARVLREDDNQPVIPWTPAETREGPDGFAGMWELRLEIPAGGLYRIETGLGFGAAGPRIWLRRGDVRFHIGVGNLFVIAGQSNAAGYGRDSAWDPPCPGVQLYRNCGRWDLAAHPMNETTDAAGAPNAENGVSGTSPYLSFGRLFRQLTGLPVGLVAASLGGSPIRRWVNRLDGDLYRNMTERLRAAGGKAAGILWYQGCSDTDTPEQAENYLGNFSEMVGDLRRELGREIPFFTFQLNRHIHNPNEARWSMVKEAQRQAAHTLNRVYVLPTSDCPMTDQIHNRSVSNVLLGERLARQCFAVLCGGQPWFAPDLESAVRCGSTVTLTFSGVRFGLETFNRLPEECFAVSGENGPLKITGWQTEGNTVRLQLAEKPSGKVTVSLGAGANPPQPPICDSTTYLPVLSFWNAAVREG
jgi:sialate O-acetylesterase